VSFALDFAPVSGSEGALSYALVPWDTELYGMPFYELRCDGPAGQVANALPQWLDAIRDRSLGGPAFAFTRVQSSDVALCETVCHNGFYPVELTLGISMPLRRFAGAHARAARRAQLRTATAADIPAISALAGGAFWADRFHLDPHLPKELSDKRYAQWVERGFRDHDSLFVYEQLAAASEDPTLLGFYLVRGEPGGEVELSLAGVETRYRGTGVGALMYEDMLEMCREAGYRVATTSISATNLDVVNLFLGLGFTVRSAQLTLHVFLDTAARGHG
jgi:ribosomal protein S18 acetylase RimI-like enzyme